MDKGSIYAFINFKQAAGFGHVAWGFQAASDRYIYGSADHLWRHDWWDLLGWWRYMDVPPGNNIDWWCEEGSRDEMLNAMKTGYDKTGKRHIFYHAFKMLNLERVYVERAMQFTAEIENHGWHVLH